MVLQLIQLKTKLVKMRANFDKLNHIQTSVENKRNAKISKTIRPSVCFKTVQREVNHNCNCRCLLPITQQVQNCTIIAAFTFLPDIFN